MASQFEAVAGKAIGYPVGLGGAITQETSKATGVTINKVTGAITTHDASLAGGAEVSFVVTNNMVGASDVPVVAIKSGMSTGTYVACVTAGAAGSFTVTIGNMGTTAGEALVISFVVLKGAAS